MNWADDVRALLKADRIEEARTACAVRLGQDPRYVEAHHLLALIEYRSGNAAQAIARLRAGLDLRPDYAAVHADLGRILGLEEELGDARRHLETAVAIDPQLRDAWHNLGVVLKRQGERDAAFDALKQALRLEPQRSESFALLAEMLIEDGQTEAAIRSFEFAIASGPAKTPLRARLAQALADTGDLDRAERLFREAVQIDSTEAEAWLGLAYLLEDRGNAREAEYCYRRALAIAPGHGFAIGRLLLLVGADADRDLVRLASWALDEASVPKEAKALVGYGLGKVHEAAGDTREAFRSYAAANAARRREASPFSRDDLMNRIERLIETYGCDSERQVQPGSKSNLPVFVVGMPRSGTTLIEQILASHPLVHGAGELSGIAEIASRKRSNPETDLAEDASNYLKALCKGARDGISRAVDKAPLNYFHLGLIARLFPAARIIHCTRDPRDVCFSIFAENFAPSQTHATDLSDLAFYWRQYRRLMEHWKRTSPLIILDVSYEETVADLATTARRLCAFLDIPWDERCLAFHENRRAVRTPSRWQVRQPIYSTSIGRWRRFAEHLGPLLDGLPPPWGQVQAG